MPADVGEPGAAGRAAVADAADVGGNRVPHRSPVGAGGGPPTQSLGGHCARSIENRLHYVRDETLGEDRCRVRTGSGPQVLAAVRNAAVYLLGQVNPKNKAAATRRLAAHPEEAVALLHS